MAGRDVVPRSNSLTIVAFDNEDTDPAVASDAPNQWGVAEIVAEATPGTSLLSLSRVNHLLFDEPAVFGGNKDRAARDAALARSRNLVDAIGAEIADVSIKRVRRHARPLYSSDRQRIESSRTGTDDQCP